MKKIGFIDYFLSEWHANNYPAWIEENVRESGREEMKVCYAYAREHVSPYDGVTTDQWCEKFGVERVDSIEELVEKSDYIVILSPDNPEFHEEFSRLPLKSGKRVYIDKTFAPDSETAKRIVDYAAANGGEFFSSSALRYAKEIADYRADGRGADSAVVIGPYTVDIYAVHILETMSTVMKRGARRLIATMAGNNRAVTVDYGEGRRALYLQCDNSNIYFQAVVEKQGENRAFAISSDFFKSFIGEMLDFFQTGKKPVDNADTLEIMRMIAAVRKALKTPDEWVEI